MPFFVFTRGVYVCVYHVFLRAHRATQIHTLPKAVTRPETLHMPVLLLCKWILLIIVSILVFYFWGYFFPIDKKSKKKCIPKKKKKKTLTACWTRVMLLTVRLLKPTHVNSSPHPLTPTRATTPLCLYEGHDVFKTQYFCILSVKCKEQGGC